MVASTTLQDTLKYILQQGVVPDQTSLHHLTIKVLVPDVLCSGNWTVTGVQV